ncbi:MAG: hypothetical protein J1F23_08265 [Oscillospiraceae bacterium]|nr:hypothetical protein [Oscillospiraceae bacterium]
MKKLFALIITFALCLSLCACGKSKETTPNPTEMGSSDTTDIVFNETEQSTSQQQSTEQKMHQEYVETYFIYAEEGAVVTWFDVNTGEFRYKWKCEFCGTTQNGETLGHSLTANGQSLNSGFVCTNSDCSMRGKSQSSIIKCNVNGEWVDVYD